MPKTELLKLEVNELEKWIVPIASGFYHETLCSWFDYVNGLKGDGLAIGDVPSVMDHIKIKYPESNTTCVDFNCPEGISWDICKPPDDLLLGKYSWIICQAVLEHVIDPVSSIKNLVSCLSEGGHLFVHTHPPGFPIHNYPIDCFRYLPHFFIGVSKTANADLLDWYLDTNNICALYRKANAI